MKPSHPLLFRASRRGAALVMTVIILALITVMVLGFADLVRNETTASSSHHERNRAQLLAEMGADLVTGVLKKQTADPALVWATKPGRLIIPDPLEDKPTQLHAEVDLHSGYPSPDFLNGGAPSTLPAYLTPANLNIQTFNDQTPTHLISEQIAPSTGQVIRLPLRWIYVRKDGTLDFDEEPDTTDSNNPITGRFAYWTDDESSKINLNTAWKRNPATGGTGRLNPFPPSHPTSINLASLSAHGVTPEMADLIHTFVTPNPPYDYADLANPLENNRFFNSVREVRALGSDFFTALNQAKFEITHYNHDPDTTFFNEPRIVLTTDPDKAAGRPFLDIAKDGVTDLWNPADHINPTKLANTIEMLNSYLSRTDWPVAPGSSFQQKYYAGKPERLTQLSLNIIDYVRSKESAGESSTKVVVPIRGDQAPGGRFVMKEVATSVDAFIGISRSPKITEMGVWIDSSPGSGGTYTAKFRAEIHLPAHFGLEQIDLALLRFYAQLNGVNLGIQPVRAAEIMNLDQPNSTLLKAGGYAVITQSRNVTLNSPRPDAVGIRVAILRGSPRLDLAPLRGDAMVPLDPPGVGEGNITTAEVDDPRVNSHADDWKRRDAGHSLGRANDGASGSEKISVLGEPPPSPVSPQQDTDREGRITDASLYMPPPARTAGNPRGVVESSGELGFIHTGMESGAGAGIPWRTLRLQPNDAGISVVPDWAFMDLFTVPVDVRPQAQPIFAPHGTGVGGRINVNAQAQPYGNPAVVPQPLERILPLTALLTGVPKDASGAVFSAAEAATLAGRVYRRTLADGGKVYGYANAYDSPGEVVEIAGIADGGEESEAVVRSIANLITTRGSVFTIYSIGQALQQTRNQKLIITAEHRQRLMLERYATPATPPQVKFRKVQLEWLTP